MKYSALYNQLRALRAQLSLPVRGLTIRIHGGMPPDYRPEVRAPGSDLQKQAELAQAGPFVTKVRKSGSSAA